MNKEISIVIVDDNEIDLMIGERLLSRVDPNIVVFTFLTGKKAINWVKERGQCDFTDTTLFLIDIYMPDCSGYFVAESIQNLFKDQTKNAECFLLSATIDFFG